MGVFRFAIALCVLQSAFGAQEPALSRLFTRYEIHEIDLQRAVERAATTRRITLDVGGKRREISLVPVSLRSPDLKWTVTTAAGIHEQEKPPGCTFRGTVDGEEESDVRLLIHEDLLTGYVRTKQEWHFIEPLNRYSPGEPRQRFVEYRPEDVREDVPQTCGGALSVVSKKVRALAPAAVAATARLIRAHIATDADAEFVAAHGTNSNLFIEGILNQVDGIYQRELGITLEIVFQNVFTDAATQPYTSSTSSLLLGQFRDEWDANHPGIARDCAHLFSGKSLEGSILGIAFLGVVCDSSAYSLNAAAALAAKVTAHEIGHNFNARHDDEFIPPAAVCDNRGPLMCASVQRFGPNSFSQRSKDDITAYVVSDGACLEIVPTADLRVQLSDSQDPVAISNTVDYSVIVTNAGPDDATGVTLTMTFRQQEATFVSINSTFGSCVATTQSATCGPIDLANGAAASAVLTLRVKAAGSFCVTAAIDADQPGISVRHTNECTLGVLHDLAVVKLKAPKKITVTDASPTVQGRFAVTIQNLSDHEESIPDLATLADLVTLQIESLGANCPGFAATLVPPKTAFPIRLPRNKKLNLGFTGTFDCVNDPLASDKTTSHADFRSIASVHHSVLGDGDSRTANDVCPHNAAGLDKGCGGKKPDGTLGGDVLTDVIVK